VSIQMQKALGLQRDHHFDLDRTVARQFRNADRRSGVTVLLSENLIEESRSGVRNARLSVEAGRRGDENDDLQYPLNAVEAADGMIQRCERVERRKFGRRLGVRDIHLSADLAWMKIAGRRFGDVSADIGDVLMHSNGLVGI
jgi:hypothetical protein